MALRLGHLESDLEHSQKDLSIVQAQLEGANQTITRQRAGGGQA